MNKAVIIRPATPDKFFYEVSMDEAARSRRLIANDLWQAVERNELQLHYQVQKAVNSLVCDGLAMAQRDQVICVAAQLPKVAMGVGPMDF